MKGLRARRVGGTVLLVLLVVAGFAAAGVASGRTPAAMSGVAADSSIHVRVGLQRFQVDRRHHSLVAQGTVRASYSSGGAVRATTARPVRLAVQTSASTCRVLHLELGQLQLQLLGLIVTLTPVNAPSIVLDITADSSEALGHLLCQVINAVQNGSLTNTTAPMSKLNLAAKKQFKGGVASFDIPLKARSGAQTTTSATTTTSTTATTPVMRGQCEVLDLILGPLHLDLLGLVVDLNTIELNISANPVGTLGTLFCGLAGTGTGTGTTAGTTTGATTTTP